MKHQTPNTEGKAREPMNDIKKKEFLIALENTLGIVSTACNQIGINKKRYYRWLEQDPEFKRDVMEITETAIDYVETQLYKQIQEGNTQATMFFLRTKAKHRGYSEQPLVAIGQMEPIQILLPTQNIPQLPNVKDIQDIDIDHPQED